MSSETITILLGIVGLLFALAGGFAWMVQRMDGMEKRLVARIDAGDERLDTRIDRLGSRIDRLDIKLGNRIDELDAKLDRRIYELGAKFDNRIDALRDEVVDLKAAVARLEGPGESRLLLSR